MIAARKKEETSKSTASNEKLKRCKVCNNEFERLLKHITMTKCVSDYGEDELEILRKEGEAERKKYKTAWKHSKIESQETKGQKCEHCQKQFNSLKQHLRQKKECQKHYSKKQILELNRQSEENRKAYKADYYEHHAPTKEQKRETRYNRQLNYQLYYTDISVNRLSSIFTNKLRWKSKESLKYQEKITRMFYNSKDSEDLPTNSLFKPLFDIITAKNGQLKDEMNAVIEFFEKLKDPSMRNTEACQDGTKSFNTYATGIFKLGDEILETIFDAVNHKTYANEETLIKMIEDQKQKFVVASATLMKQHEQDLEKVKLQHEDRLTLWRLVKRTADHNPMAIFNKLKEIWFAKVQDTLDTYSTWIPKYKAKIEEFRKQKGIIRKNEEILTNLQRNINETFSECNEKVKDFKSRINLIKVAEFDTRAYVAPTIEKFVDVVYNSKILMERNEVLLRLELYFANEELNQFGYVASYSEEENKLKFGLDPDFDYIGNGVDKYQRFEEYEDKRHLRKRLQRETDEFLKKWLKCNV